MFIRRSISQHGRLPETRSCQTIRSLRGFLRVFIKETENPVLDRERKRAFRTRHPPLPRRALGGGGGLGVMRARWKAR